VIAAWLAAYALTGAFVGFLAGLLGIGGGMTLVPILAAMFAAQQFAPGPHGAPRPRHRHGLGDVHLDRERARAPPARRRRLGAGAPARPADGRRHAALDRALGWVPQRVLALSFAVIVFAGATQILLGKKPAPAAPCPARRRWWRSAWRSASSAAWCRPAARS
jgi:hypothetical protein